MDAITSHTLRALSRHWIGRLATYRQHRNDEHREALVAEAMRYAGLRLETYLDRSPYWSEAPLSRRAAILLYLVDRGAVLRGGRNGRVVYEATDDAEVWVLSQPSLSPYVQPTLDLIAALRLDHAWRLAGSE